MATPIQYCQTGTFYLAGSGSIVGDNTITLTSFADIYGNVLTMSNFGVKGFCTAEPDTTNEEAFTFTNVVANANGTFTLTGVSTVLAESPYTETSGLVRAHAGGLKVVVTDNVAFWNTFANKANDETVTGQWTFSTFPITPSNSQATDTVAGIATLKVHNYAADTGSANTYVIAPSPAITAYTTGAIFSFKAANANTGASTLNINSLGVKTIKKNVTTDLGPNDILANQIIIVEYDGTNFQLISNPASIVTDSAPNIRTFTAMNGLGNTTTQFTITNPSGTTFTYTYTGTGTNPGTLNTLMPVGSIASVQSTSMSAANTGVFTITASTATSFSITNASGVAEATKTLANGGLDIGTVYTPTTGTKWIEVEVIGGGAQGGASTTSTIGSGGGAGAYLKKILSSGFSGLQAIVGAATTSSNRTPYGLSAFGISLVSNSAFGTLGGSLPTGGDINAAGNSAAPSVTSTGSGMPGAASFLGGAPVGGVLNGVGVAAVTYGAGGSGGGTQNPGTAGGVGMQGAIIITEHFI